MDAFAFALEITCEDAAKYMKPPWMRKIYEEGTIVLIKRYKQYPTGHYIISHNGRWMDF